MMRFLADENIPMRSVQRLRAHGCDMRWVSEVCSGAPDRQVMALARRESRLLLTFDRDFGQLVFRHGYEPPPGIVYLRFIPACPEEVADLVIRLVEERIVLTGMFTVCDRDCVRQRPLPCPENL